MAMKRGGGSPANKPARSGAASAPGQPMDAAVREQAVGTPHVNTSRLCYAAQTLVAEVEALFPETPHETSNMDGRNTALDVQFDVTVLDDPDRVLFVRLLSLVEDDVRVVEVITDDEPVSHVLVSFQSNARTQDLRDPFGLDEAFDILAGGTDETDLPVIAAQPPALASDGERVRDGGGA